MRSIWLVSLFKLFLLIAVCELAIAQDGPHSQMVPGGPPDARILFIGNSLTYVNDLPSLVSEIAARSGKRILTETIAFPNYALEDHWNDGVVQERIRTGDFDFVVIQQGPSSREYGRESLVASGSQLKSLCDKHGARLAYYMVWPARQYYDTFDGVIANYRNAATLNNALLIPVGEHWKSHFDASGDFSYYGPDQFHPSMKGSLVAARVIFETLLTEGK